ncbi:MAG: BamA/TamA family outer membrane protein [Myxococcales bacterium]|nr:BamA/TamA family outer membrane protein [Myxococcales bacterium]
MSFAALVAAVTWICVFARPARAQDTIDDGRGLADVGPSATPSPPTAAPAPLRAAEEAPVLGKVSLRGTLQRTDRVEDLEKFLDLRLPARWDEATQARLRNDIEATGYQVRTELRPLETALGSSAKSPQYELIVHLTPLRVVRRIYVQGNWPIFSVDILSYMTWRTGYRLPEGDALAAEISKQEQELVSFLQRRGYYGAAVLIELSWPPEQPGLVDVYVRVRLNAGFLRLRYNIGEIRATGFSLLSREQLADFFDHCCLWVGRTSTERLNDDFKRLIDYYQSQGYVGVRLTKREVHPDPRQRRVDLDLAIEERRRIALLFPGSRRIKTDDLRAAVTIFRDNYASANELDESARNIFRLYQQRGFFDARVTWRWRDRTSDPMQVEFQIYEGPQFKVRELEFVSDDSSSSLHYSDARLSELITTRRYPRLGAIGLGQGGFASAIQLEQDVRRLEEFYRREGYPQPRVTAYVARSHSALESAPLLGLDSAVDIKRPDADLVVRFSIHEGRREVVDAVEVEFVGAHSQSEAQVRKVLSMSTEKPYTLEALEQDKQSLVRLFSSVGRPYAAIDAAQSTWNEAHDRVVMHWRIEEGEPVFFGPVLIRGNFVTRESLIRSDLPFRPGDPYDFQKLMEAQQNLLSRQIFNSVRITPNPGETDEFRLEARQKGWKLNRNPIPILIEISERYDSVGELNVAVGVSTDNPFYGTASYTWRNVLGVGTEVEVRGEFGVRVQSLLLRIAQPRLWSRFLRLDLSGFWRNENRYSVGLVNFYGANAELTRAFYTSADDQGRLLQPTVRLFTRLELNFSQIQVPLYRAEGTTSLPSNGDQTQSLKLSAGIVWERREGLEAPGLRLRNRPVPINPVMPYSGFLVSGQITGSLCCSLEPNSFDGNGSFIALAFQALLLKPHGPVLRTEDGWPYPGMRRFNIKLNLRVNYGIPLLRPALPVVERFFAGGDTTTRGYDNDALRAEEVRAPVGSLYSDLGYRVVPQGGNVRILSQIEWEFAITQKLPWPWVGALFVDTGAVFDGWDQLRWNDFRFSVGLSLLRLLTPLGPISLDYAYPLTLPGQSALLQSDRWKHEPAYAHFPGRIHFTWGMPLSF